MKLIARAAAEQEQSAQALFSSLIRSCGRSKDSTEGRRIHQVILGGGKLDRFLGNLLVEMYGKCGCPEEASALFDSIPCKNIYSWTIMLNSLVQNGLSDEGLRLLRRMDLEGVRLDECTFLGVLAAVSALGDLKQGRVIHERILQSGIDVGLIIGSALVNMYCKCRSLVTAREVFSGMPDRNVVSWTCLMAAYVENRCFHEALGMFRDMQLEGVKPDKLAFASAVEACGAVGRISEGTCIHDCIRVSGLENDPYLRNAIITMYGKRGLLELARQVFFHESFLSESNVVSWTALVSAYTQHGHSREAVKLYHRMNLEGVKPDKVAFVAILDAAANAAAGDQAKALHDSVVSSGFESDTVVGNSLVNLYGKCGRVDDAKAAFDKLAWKDVVSWGSLLTVYAQNGLGKQVLELFTCMDVEGCRPDALVFVSVVDACTSLSRLSTGKLVHQRIVYSGFGHHNDLCNSLINMYSKCGRLDIAENMFYKLELRDTVAWNSVVISFAQHGDWPRAGRLYTEMHLEGMKPSKVTLISILSACRHAGLVEQARDYFVSMVWDHGIVPSTDHYGCLIDLMGKAGWLRQAEELVDAMPVQPAVTSWTALLGACRIHGDVDRASQAAGNVVGLDPESIAGFVLLSNSFAPGDLTTD